MFLKILYKILSLFILISVSVNSFADTIHVFTDSIMFNNIEQSQIIEQNIDWKRLGFHTGMFVGCGATMLIILEALPENATAWNKAEIKSTPVFKRYWNHVRQGPVIDKDNPTFNYILHPYAGAVYYQAARGSGCNMWQSFMYSFFVSNVLWEYGYEAFNEIPSVQDLVITPVIGSMIGEGFYIAKKKIVMNDYRVCNSRGFGKTLCWVLDPFNEFANIFLTRKDVVTSSFIMTKDMKMITLTVKI